MAKTVGGVTTNYLVDTNNPTGYAQVVDELQGGAVVRSFTYGHDLISQRIVGGSLSFYQYDGHGSVRQLTDAAATVTDAYDYDAFGNLIYRSGTTPNDYLYCGEQFDTSLGFYYLRARYLNTSTARFWTTDPAEGALGEPHSLHRYLYAGGDPVNRLDPSGLFSFVDTGASSTINNMPSLSYQSVLRMVQPQLVDAALAEIAAAGIAGPATGASISAGTILSSALAFFAGFGAGALVSTATRNNDDSDKEVFYRVMSATEYRGLGPKGEITVQGTENFVTQSPEYVLQLAARHPDLYQYLVVYRMEAGTRDAMIAKGAVSQSAIENTPSLARLPSISTFPKNFPDIVHIKGETGNALTYGLRRGTVGIFNSRIVDFQGVGP